MYMVIDNCLISRYTIGIGKSVMSEMICRECTETEFEKNEMISCVISLYVLMCDNKLC